MKTTADQQSPGSEPEANADASLIETGQSLEHASLLPSPEPIFDLRLVPFPEAYVAGARNAVSTCLRIDPKEKVTLITDEACLQVAASIAVELDKTGCAWNAFVLEALAPR